VRALTASRVIFALVLLAGTIQAQPAAVVAAPEARPTCSIKWIAPSSSVTGESEKSSTWVVSDPNSHRIVVDSDGISASTESY
jgi:hypothetical protein